MCLTLIFSESAFTLEVRVALFLRLSPLCNRLAVTDRQTDTHTVSLIYRIPRAETPRGVTMSLFVRDNFLFQNALL